MQNFKIHIPSINVQGILDELKEHPELWDQHPFRTKYNNGAPFGSCSDIILQYNDLGVVPTNWLETVPFPAMYILKAAQFAAHTLMYAFRLDRLGRVMITRLPPGGYIGEHSDDPLLTTYYNRYHVCLQDNDKTEFHCGDEMFRPTPGMVYSFDNSKLHAVVNNGDTDRLTMIVDIKKPVLRAFYGNDESWFPKSDAPKEELANMRTSAIDANVTYGKASFNASIPELEKLAPLHWQELALTKDSVPLDVDWTRFVQIEQAGSLFTYVMRHEGKIVGYYIGMVGGHLHYKSTKHCSVDLYYILPDFRRNGLGAEFFKAAEDELRLLGVMKVVQGCKLHQDHIRFFESLGYTETDRQFIKMLN